MQLKKMTCPQCGAAIPPEEDVCPYCGSSFYGPEAERAYMRKLEDLRSDLDRVGEAGAVESGKEIGRLGKKIVRILLVIFLIAAAITVFVYTSDKKENEKNRREYEWRREAFPKMEELFTAGEYDALLTAYNSAGNEGHDLYNWKHRGFCEIYESIGYADTALHDREKGIFRKEDAVLLLGDELRFRGLPYRADIPSEDKKILDPMLERFSGDLTEVFTASQEEIEAFDRTLQQSSGYVSYKMCEEFVEKHPEILREDSH